MSERNWPASLLLLAGMLSLLTTVHGAEPPKLALSVPATEATLHVAVPVPPGTLKPGAGRPRLLELEPAGKPLAYDLIPAMMPDGSPDPTRLRLMASIPPRPGATGVRRFGFRPDDGTGPSVDKEAFAISDVDAKSIKLECKAARGVTRPVLVYNHGMISKPGVAARYNRACYIHPLYGLNGEIITEDFATDHRHHRGVWWSWPHIKIEGKEYNSWIPAGIHYQHERWTLKTQGTAVGVLAAENGWYVGKKKVVQEHVWIVAYRAAGSTRVVDLELTWTPLDKPVTLQGAGGKSYGGLSFRLGQAKDEPRANKRKDTKITVETGLTKRDLPNTRLKWADISGLVVGAKERSGCALFVAKDHPDFPPTWLTRHYGPLCIGWPGVRPKTFFPGKPFRCRYRLFIHLGDADLDALKAAYAAYNSGDQIQWEKGGK